MIRTLMLAGLLAAAPGLAPAQTPAQPPAQPGTMPGMDMSQPAGTAMSGPMTPASQAYMQPMRKMQQDMQAMPMTGDPDKDFVMMMTPHHQAAVGMAQAYLKYGTDPGLKKMAQDIISSQEAEIRQMDAWMAAHGGMGHP